MHADEIDPRARAAVERQQRFSLPHSRRGVKALRLLTRAAVWVRNRNPPSVGRAVDRTIPGPAGDLYLPDVDGPFPTVVFFHGGGFVLGSVATHDWLCRHLAHEGAVDAFAFVFSPYRPHSGV